FWDAQLASRVALADPAATREIPAALLQSTAMNGLAHCIEGLYSTARSPIASGLALDATSRFGSAMRELARDAQSDA
ncbi:iron-containing alcohol dehydrogenase, partial [Variovorax sp. 2RAF20]